MAQCKTLILSISALTAMVLPTLGTALLTRSESITTLSPPPRCGDSTTRARLTSQLHLALAPRPMIPRLTHRLWATGVLKNKQAPQRTTAAAVLKIGRAHV